MLTKEEIGQSIFYSRINQNNQLVLQAGLPGLNVLVAYIDEPNDGHRYYPMTLKDYVSFLSDDVVLAIDPANNNQVISHTYAAEILESVQNAKHEQVAEPIDTDLKINFKQPENVPAPLIYGLFDLHETYAEALQKVWLLWITDNQSGISNWLVLVDGEKALSSQAISDIRQTFKQHLSAELAKVDIMPKAALQLDTTQFKELW